MSASRQGEFRNQKHEKKNEINPGAHKQSCVFSPARPFFSPSLDFFVLGSIFVVEFLDIS
jgi:hypothetical protein